MASHGGKLGDREMARLKALHLAHLRVDLHLSRPDHGENLQRAVTESQALGVPLEIAVFVSDAAKKELNVLRGLLEDARPEVRRWMIFHETEKSTSERWVRLARDLLAKVDPNCGLGAGSKAYFTELNRGRPPVGSGVLDFVCYSINPQVHAFDNRSIVENLQAQGATVACARELAGGLPVVVTPVTLRPRFNPNATGPAAGPATGELPAEVDPRQMSLLGAGWTLGSLSALIAAGASSLTYYETTGGAV